MIAAYREDEHRVAQVLDWRGRLTKVRLLMRSAPTSPRYWFWRIEEKIVAYLIRRYGSPDTAAFTDSYGQRPTLGGRIYRLPTRNRLLISRDRMKALLEDIQTANEKGLYEHGSGE